MKSKVEIKIRAGKPKQCVVCKGALHRKSEHYCGLTCHRKLTDLKGETLTPPFLSKWKIRKRKTLSDPILRARQKTRRKTNELVRRGKLKKKPCVVCGTKEVVAHHEDCSNPFSIIWICEPHHKDYHKGKLSLFGGTLRWGEKRLIPKNLKQTLASGRFT